MVTGALALAACGGDGFGPPSATPPAAPAENDGRYTVGGVGAWYLVGNALTPGQDEVELVVDAPGEAEVVDVWIDGGPGQRLTRDGARFSGALDIGALAPGPHQILIAANTADTAAVALTFNRTHPLYFLMTTDWDFAEPGQTALDYHDQLRTEHPELKYTHFIGPYTFTDPNLAEARKAELAAWAIARRDQHGDELGLHIHPWCHFVEAAGLACNTTLSTVYQTDATGYTIKLEAYGQAGFETLLDKADALFVERGLGKPVTFRAGGWTAVIDTLKALAAKGYVADTSALNWARLEEWIGNGNLYTWNMTNWSSMGDTSQPYYPNTTDKQSDAAPTVPILEVPDNAIMVDYVTRQEMIDIFALNWPGTALPEPRTYMMGFHPAPSMSVEEFRRLDGILDHADLYRASQHAGPVVYARLKDMPAVWPAD
jgi:hypothetical protein